MASDPNTQSNYDAVTTMDMGLEWQIDFDTQTISGLVSYRFKNIVKEGVDKIVLDTLDLEVEKVRIFGNFGWENAEFSLGEAHPVMGSALTVFLNRNTLRANGQIPVDITYKTRKGKALQWLDPEQTWGGQHPFLYSQCKPIYARSLVPIQDTPSAKIRYSAEVKSKFPVLMSARRVAPPVEQFPDAAALGNTWVTYKYDQDIPIPPYLLAIVSGNVIYRAFDVPKEKTWTSGVWAEPHNVDAAWNEFHADVPRFLAAAEELMTPYQFRVYDLLVLPPAFPYEAMENACLTFVAPTLLAGDKSLLDVVARKITHSWFGNTITHAHASHAWLSDSLATYMARVLQERLYTPAHRGLSYLIGRKSLDDDLARFADRPRFQRLQIDFEPGEDLDEAYSSSVPHEKGANFMLHLERTLGGLDLFLRYVKTYVQRFRGQRVTTQMWKEEFIEYFSWNDEKSKAVKSILWDEWLTGEGSTLPVPITYDETLAQAPYALAARWDEARTIDPRGWYFEPGDIAKMNMSQIIVFLERLQADTFTPLPYYLIDHLWEVYRLAETPNYELWMRFYLVALRLDREPWGPVPALAKKYAPRAARWITGEDRFFAVGQINICRPVLRAVVPFDRDLAVELYKAHKTEYHPIARSLIEKDLGMDAVM